MALGLMSIRLRRLTVAIVSVVLLAQMASASAITSMLASMPVDMGAGYDLFRRAALVTTCGNVTAAESVDCCQPQAPIFCPAESGTCFTSNGYIGCCSRPGGCVPKTTCFPHSALKSCDPDTGGCTACTNQLLPYCAVETNVVAQQYIMYCHSISQTLTHSYTLNAAEISRGSAEAASRASTSQTGSSSTSTSTTTSATGSATSGTSSSQGGSDRLGAIVGGVIGGLALLALIGVAIFFGLAHWRKTRGSGYQAPPMLLNTGHSELDGSEPSGTLSSHSPYSLGGNSNGMSNYGQSDGSQLYPVPYHPPGHPDRWNGSPAPHMFPQRYSYGQYGDLQHPGYLQAVGPLAVVNRTTPAPATPAPTQPIELEEQSPANATVASGVGDNKAAGYTDYQHVQHSAVHPSPLQQQQTHFPQQAQFPSELQSGDLPPPPRYE